MITAGLDIGSSAAKAVLLEDTGRIISAMVPTGASSSETAERVLNNVLSRAALSRSDMAAIVSTGYGRINVPFADRHVTEISCHARGINYDLPDVRTILDMGGQDCKAIRCDGHGKVLKFEMNEKCAAGTGRYLERVSATLELPLHDIGKLSLETVKGPAAISSFCAVFAQDDVLLLLRQGVHINDILAGVCEAMAERVQTIILKLGLQEDFAVCGGIAKNIGIVKRLERNFGVTAYVPREPQLAGALGAALFAMDLITGTGKAGE